jgi:formate hydrogenlyase transcriptional activator
VSTVDQPQPSAEGTGGRLEFETLLADISSRFVNLPPGEVDREIEDALRRVCESLRIDYAVLWQFAAAAPGVIIPTHAYPPLASPQTPDLLQQESFPWVVQEMQAGRMVVVAALDDMPEEAAVDRESARLSGILSNLTVPLSVGGAPPVGALALNMWRAPRDWPDPLVNRLQLVAQVFANALARRRDDQAMRLSQTRLQAGADLAGLAFYEVDYANGTAYFDNRFRDLCGLPPDRESGLQPVEFWAEHLHADDRGRVVEARRQMHEGVLEQLLLEYRYQHPIRGEIWLHHVARSAARDASGRTLRTTGVFRDITNRKRAEEQLRQSLAEVERLKDRLEAESDYLKAEIQVAQAQHEVTGKSAAIQAVLRQAEQVAPMDSTVLVSGETGTGKELLAQAIHRLGPRGRHVMVKVNCAALPSSLVESELFGREKGAFTGAMSRQVGRFELADSSTLFLDEVGELPPDVQVKLLRVLQAGEFERLGSPRTIKVNVRVIAATNRNLAEEVRTGRFREDLFYRLNVFPIRMPPLRERPDDIPLLVWTFLDDFSARMGKRITQVPRATMQALQRQPWPGNVRELRNVIERGAIITTGSSLRLPVFDGAASMAPPTQTLAEAEREHILRVLESVAWRVKGPTGAAAVLAINPSTLRSRMKKLGIPTRRPVDDRSA